ncbi:anti-sigma factor family protein [Acidisoma silvae]|uniref:Anti-sigma factor n=1 Tax=Acidisoma silvae TaxID=2802396 RepID=A0A963YPK5_9PROT|nr:zf-HC2 domain-containing protein [Acidisoma silvae]MCB8874343.1 anti-sigma factor [Acidisoma silvae]
MTRESCEGMDLLIQAELDGELGAAEAAALTVHLAGCETCQALRQSLGSLSARLRADAPRYAAPPHLRRAVLADVASQPSWRGRVATRWSKRDAGWFGAGAALAAGLSLLAWLPLHSPDQSNTDAFVSAHIRALQPGHLFDVASTDRHTVKPWFDGRLDFAPPVRDLAAQGYPLTGGRLDYIAGRAVAALVYRRDKHLIDLFVWPGSGAASFHVVQGYNIFAWSQGGMNFRAVSDLEAGQMDRFKHLLTGKT